MAKLGAAVGLAVLLGASSACAEEPGRPALPFLVTGGISLGLGVANLATAPLCTVSIIRPSAQPACVGASIGFGVAFLTAGIPLLVVGVGRRREGGQVSAEPTAGGGLVTWRTSF